MKHMPSSLDKSIVGRQEAPELSMKSPRDVLSEFKSKYVQSPSITPKGAHDA